jgi:alpha-beta hydrolase superfamily lysophospholipase
MGMSKWLIRFPLKLAGWGLGIVGAATLVLVAMVATPLKNPPELHSLSAARKNVNYSTLPAIERFQARDGTLLGFRHYSASDPASGRAAIVIHGSSGSSGTSIHALSQALAARGIETWAIDIRGHGTSGTRGDIGYVGQLEDDLDDFVAVVRKSAPSLPITLIGHSAGGGFALRVASSPIGPKFARTMLLAPYLGYDAPTNRPDSGGWARADIPRILGLMALRKLGIDCCDALPTLAFAVPLNSASLLVPAYSDRLMRNFATRGYRTDLAAATGPLTIISGAADELMLADKYVEAVRGIAPSVDVKLIDGVDHIGIVSDPRALAVIAEDVAKAGPGS